MLQSLLNRLWSFLKSRVDLELDARLAPFNNRLAELEAQMRTAKAPPKTLVPMPQPHVRFMPEDLPPEVAKLVDWQRMGVELPEEKP